MNSPNDKHERLEKYIDSVLRAQPPRRAPASLQGNVLAAIARRARPWWQQSFAAWPLAAKALFLVCSIGFVKIGLMIADFGTSPFEATAGAQIPQSVAWVHTLSLAITAIFKLIPNFWLYAVVAVLGAMYVLLFGVSAAAYRTLYAPR
jgi:hypothetical protein